jgi:hypothetical protein
MEALGWMRRRGSSPAARRGARQRAGLTPAAASNTLSSERETSQSKNPLDINHGIYRHTRRSRNFRSDVLGFQKCVGDQFNSQGRNGVAAANCESFLHLIFDRIGGAGAMVRAGGSGRATVATAR